MTRAIRVGGSAPIVGDGADDALGDRPVGSVGSAIAACSGNLVEWYDLHVAGLLIAYLAVAFFPASTPAGGFFGIAGIFALGLLIRPIGGWVFGRIADRSGRRRSLVLSALAMTTGFLVMALVPVYAQIGGWAPFVLLVARLIQGFAVGGEYGTVAAYLSETMPRARRCYYGAFQYMALVGGQVAALLAVVALRHLLGDGALAQWGWRIPFAIGAVASLVALVARLRLPEPLSLATAHPGAGSMKLLLGPHRATFVRALALTAGGVLGVFTFAVYAKQAMTATGALSAATSEWIMTACLIGFMGLQLPIGALADRVGYRFNLLAFGIVGAISTVPILYGLSAVSDPYAAAALTGVGLVIISLYSSVCGIVKADMFPAEIRGLGVGFCSSLASVAFAGSAAVIVSGLTAVGHPGLFHAYVTAMVALVAVVGFTLPRAVRRRPSANRKDYTFV